MQPVQPAHAAHLKAVVASAKALEEVLHDAVRAVLAQAVDDKLVADLSMG